MPPRLNPQTDYPSNHLPAFFLVAFSSLALALGYWTVIARDTLLARDDNPRALIAFNRVQRGSILDRNGLPLAESTGLPGNYLRRYEPSTALVVGYASFTYGLGGIESAADPILTGIEGQEEVALWWRRDVLNEPQIGSNVQLTLDLNLQRVAFQALADHAGAVVILDPFSGEILVLASSPSFDPARIDEEFESFTEDSNGPLINRATTALYRADALLDRFPPTLDLSQTPPLPIPLRPAEGKRITPLHLTLLAAAIANEGVMPSPQLVLAPDRQLTEVGIQSPLHPIAIIPPADAELLRPALQAGYIATIPSGFEDETLGWYVALGAGGKLAICIVLENSTGPEAAALANTIDP